MLHLMKYNLIVKTKCINVIFWPLVFPLILGTLFYFAFGSIDEADFETVQTIVVKEADADPVFLEFLETMETDESRLVELQEMSREEARRALEEKKASGIYFVGETPMLKVAGSGISESILESLLESYQNGKQTLSMVAEKHPEGIQKAIEQMDAYEELVKQVSLGGTTTNSNAQFFYALIAMACLYGAFFESGEPDCAGGQAVCDAHSQTEINPDGNAVLLSAALPECADTAGIPQVCAAAGILWADAADAPDFSDRQHDGRVYGYFYRRVWKDEGRGKGGGPAGHLHDMQLSGRPDERGYEVPGGAKLSGHEQDQSGGSDHGRILLY